MSPEIHPSWDAAKATAHLADRPKGLADVAHECRERGYSIPEPDHTAEGDVRATRAVYEALRAIRVTTTEGELP